MMDVNMYAYPPGDPQLVDRIVNEFLSQGKFDKLRKECMADADTKPAYQNLQQRVESTVTQYLKKQTWKPDLNKNQLRDSLRKHILESGFLDAGINRIVDQVVNPNVLATVFLPEVEEVVYSYLSIPKPPERGQPKYNSRSKRNDAFGDPQSQYFNDSLKEQAADISKELSDTGFSESADLETLLEEKIKNEVLEKTPDIKIGVKVEEDSLSETKEITQMEDSFIPLEEKMEVISDESQGSLSRMNDDKMIIGDQDTLNAPDSDASIPLEINEKSLSDSRDSDDSIMNKMSPISQGKSTPDLTLFKEDWKNEKNPLTFVGRIPKLKKDDLEPKLKEDLPKKERADNKSGYSSDESDSSKLSPSKSDSDERKSKKYETKKEDSSKSHKEEKGHSSDKSKKRDDQYRSSSKVKRDRSKDRKGRDDKSRSKRDVKEKSDSRSRDQKRDRSRDRSSYSSEKKNSHSREKSSTNHHNSGSRERSRHRDGSKYRSRDRNKYVSGNKDRKSDKNDKNDRDDKKKREDEKKKKSKSVDDHSKERNKRENRRSTDRDSNERERDRSISGSRTQSEDKKREKEQKADSRKDKGQKDGSDSKDKKKDASENKTESEFVAEKMGCHDGKVALMMPSNAADPRNLVKCDGEIVFEGLSQAELRNCGESCPVNVLDTGPVANVDWIFKAKESEFYQLDLMQMLRNGDIKKVSFPATRDDFYQKFNSTGFRYFEDWETVKMDCEEDFKEYVDEAEDNLSLVSDDGSDLDTFGSEVDFRQINKSIIENLKKGVSNFEGSLLFDPTTCEFYSNAMSSKSCVRFDSVESIEITEIESKEAEVMTQRLDAILQENLEEKLNGEILQKKTKESRIILTTTLEEDDESKFTEEKNKENHDRKSRKNKYLNRNRSRAGLKTKSKFKAPLVDTTEEKFDCMVGVSLNGFLGQNEGKMGVVNRDIQNMSLVLKRIATHDTIRVNSEGECADLGAVRVTRMDGDLGGYLVAKIADNDSGSTTQSHDIENEDMKKKNYLVGETERGTDLEANILEKEEELSVENKSFSDVNNQKFTFKEGPTSLTVSSHSNLPLEMIENKDICNTQSKEERSDKVVDSVEFGENITSFDVGTSQTVSCVGQYQMKENSSVEVEAPGLQEETTEDASTMRILKVCAASRSPTAVKQSPSIPTSSQEIISSEEPRTKLCFRLTDSDITDVTELQKIMIGSCADSVEGSDPNFTNQKEVEMAVLTTTGNLILQNNPEAIVINCGKLINAKDEMIKCTSELIESFSSEASKSKKVIVSDNCGGVNLTKSGDITLGNTVEPVKCLEVSHQTVTESIHGKTENNSEVVKENNVEIVMENSMTLLESNQLDVINLKKRAIESIFSSAEPTPPEENVTNFPPTAENQYKELCTVEETTDKISTSIESYSSKKRSPFRETSEIPAALIQSDLSKSSDSMACSPQQNEEIPPDHLKTKSSDSEAHVLLENLIVSEPTDGSSREVASGGLDEFNDTKKFISQELCSEMAENSSDGSEHGNLKELAFLKEVHRRRSNASDSDASSRSSSVNLIDGANRSSPSFLPTPKMDMEAKIRLFQMQSLRRARKCELAHKSCILARISSGKTELEKQEDNFNSDHHNCNPLPLVEIEEESAEKKKENHKNLIAPGPAKKQKMNCVSDVSSSLASTKFATLTSSVDCCTSTKPSAKGTSLDTTKPDAQKPRKGLRVGLSKLRSRANSPLIDLRTREVKTNAAHGFNMPLSPESDDSVLNNSGIAVKLAQTSGKVQKRNAEIVASSSLPQMKKPRDYRNQKYDCQDLYKPRPFSIGFRKRHLEAQPSSPLAESASTTTN